MKAHQVSKLDSSFKISVNFYVIAGVPASLSTPSPPQVKYILSGNNVKKIFFKHPRGRNASELLYISGRREERDGRDEVRSGHLTFLLV